MACGHLGIFDPTRGPLRPERRRAALLLAAAAVIAIAAGRRLSRVEVAGGSMRPGLEPGDRLLVVRGLPVRERDIVAVRDPRDEDRVLVKRVSVVWPDGSVEVHGDDPGASTDSREFGPVDRRLLQGRAVYRYWPEDRRGPLGSRG